MIDPEEGSWIALAKWSIGKYTNEEYADYIVGKGDIDGPTEVVINALRSKEDTEKARLEEEKRIFREDYPDLVRRHGE